MQPVSVLFSLRHGTLSRAAVHCRRLCWGCSTYTDWAGTSVDIPVDALIGALVDYSFGTSVGTLADDFGGSFASTFVGISANIPGGRSAWPSLSR